MGAVPRAVLEVGPCLVYVCVQLAEAIVQKLQCGGNIYKDRIDGPSGAQCIFGPSVQDIEAKLGSRAATVRISFIDAGDHVQSIAHLTHEVQLKV